MPIDPRFEEERHPEPELFGPLSDSVEIMRLFRVKDRTGLKDFLPGLNQIDARFAKYATMKGEQWRKESVDTHMLHALGHLHCAIAAESFKELFTQLTATALRSLAAITCLVVRYARVRESVSAVRADTSAV